MKKLLLCGADADNSSKLDYNNKWYAILDKKLNGVDTIYYLSANTLISETAELFNNYYCYYPADAVVIDFLLEDCLPRNVRNSSLPYRLIKQVLGKRISNALSMIFLKPSPKKVNTPLPLYEKCYKTLVDGFVNKGVQYIFLMKYNFDCKNEYLNELLKRQTIAYTAIMSRMEQDFSGIVRVVDVLVHLDGDCMNGMYYDKEGNKNIAEALYAELKDILQ